jgi:arsenate reductase
MPNPGVTIYHNPRCSKSRNALTLLQQNGIEPKVIEYLKYPPDKAELKRIVQKLGVAPEQIVRKGEEMFKQHYAGKTLSDDQWLDALAAHPILIERPIVVRNERAVVGRPPENVLDLI